MNNLQAPVTLDNLISMNRIPPVVAVFVGSRMGGRDDELACNEAFIDALAQEIVPWVRSNYHVAREPERTIIAGYSLGGLTAACAALRHPDVFGNVLSQSGSFWWKPVGEFEGEWLAKQFASRPTARVKFYLDVGLLEMGTGGNATPNWVQTDRIPYGPSMIVVNRHMRDVLKLKGYTVHYAEVGGAHNAINWRGTFADGLLALIGTAQPPRSGR